MIITRFAPSPTGFLHIGGLRTALFCYLWAKKNKGKFLLRIEDTDLARNSEAAKDAILKAFAWVGLKPDDEIIFQSKRSAIYKQYLQQLLDEKKAYYCYMSKDELDALRAKQKANGELQRYDGTYRDFQGEPPHNEPVIRLKVPQEGSVNFKDGVKGELNFDWQQFDDFIIARSDGSPTYNFVVAVDDHLMQANCVIRGDDHVSNTPKQIAIYQAFGWDLPEFFHVPMILNENKQKLSKRDGALDVMAYQEMGYLPQSLLNFLLRLGFSHGDQEIISFDEAIKYFNPYEINKAPSAYNLSKLAWINGEYLKALGEAELTQELLAFDLDLSTVYQKTTVLKLALEKAQTLLQLKNNILELTEVPQDYNAKDMKKFGTSDSIKIVQDFISSLSEVDFSTSEHLQARIDYFLQGQKLKMPALGKPLRLLMFGKSSGANLADLLLILGPEAAKARLEHFKKCNC